MSYFLKQLYIPSAIKTQMNLVLLLFWSRLDYHSIFALKCTFLDQNKTKQLQSFIPGCQSVFILLGILGIYSFDSDHVIFLQTAALNRRGFVMTYVTKKKDKWSLGCFMCDRRGLEIWKHLEEKKSWTFRLEYQCCQGHIRTMYVPQSSVSLDKGLRLAELSE